jgi:uncharacterized repeat protein (TIGR01451 family)
VGQFSPDKTLAGPLSPARSIASAGFRARSLFAGLPLMFEPNQGQANLDPADPQAQFIARGSGYSLLLGTEGAMLRLYSRSPSDQGPSKQGSSKNKNSPAAQVESLEMKLAGGNPDPSLTGTDLLPGKSNYLLGNNPAKWRRGIPQFGRVRYEQVYPGINLVFYGTQGHLEYDFQVGPGADPTQAELEFSGAKRVELKDGALVICGENGRSDDASVRLEAPRVYQEIAGRKQPVEGRFVLRGANRIGFAIGSYDRSRELVIDPELFFSTYFGGTGDELNTSVAVDSSSNIYLAGSTDSLNLPVTSGVFQSQLKATPPNTNVYIAKITPPLGTSPAVLAYVTYLGGSGTDYPVGIAVDGAAHPYVAGTTTSTDFPTTATGYQSTPESPNNPHVFVTRLDSAAASLFYSSYLSGNGNDTATGMTIDGQQNIYVTGTTTSIEALFTTPDQFPATQIPALHLAYQNTPRSGPGVPQFFVTQVDTNAQHVGSITYSTYFGGGDFTLPPPPAPQTPAIGGGIAVDTNLNIYFTGTTDFTNSGTSATTDFPILNAYQPCLDQPPPTTIVGNPPCTYANNTTPQNFDAFAAKLNPNVAPGEQLQWSTYLGGTQSDFGNAIAVDTGAANVFVTGTTNSQDFVASSTFFSIASYQKCLNNLFSVSGTTITCTTQTNPAPSDAFVARLTNPTTSSTATSTNVSLTYFSYLGGQNDEEGLAITVDSADGALITGWTQSPSNFVLQNNAYQPQSGTFPVFPYPSPIQSQLNGTQDAFVARLNSAASTISGQTTIASWAAYYGGSAVGQGTGIALDVNNNLYVAGNTDATDLQLDKPLQPQNNGGNDAFVAQLGTAASLSISGVLTLGQNQTYISAGNQATFTYTLTNNGPDLATGITFTDNISAAYTQWPLTYNSASATSSGSCSAPSTSSVVACTIPSLQAGSTATITITLTPSASSSGNPAQFNGGAVQVTAANGINIATTSVPAQMSDYTISVSPSNATVAAGNTATYTVQLIPHPVFGSSIALSVTIPPGLTGTTQTFSTSSVTLQGTSPASSTLSITTTARPITTPTGSLWKRGFYAMFFAVPGLALVGTGMGSDRRRRRVVGILLLCCVLSMVLLQPACSHTSTPPPVSGTQAGSYTLTIAASSGSDTKNVSIVLNVL